MCNNWEPVLLVGVSEAFLSTWPLSSAFQLHGWRNRLTDGAELLSRVSDLSGSFVRYRTIFLFEQLETWIRVEKRRQTYVQKTFCAKLWRGFPVILIISCQCLLPISPFTGPFLFLCCSYLNCFHLSLPGLHSWPGPQNGGKCTGMAFLPRRNQ